jgi:ssDNA-binding Zn-finger/Zn-ribbon topoisomerase 1
MARTVFGSVDNFRHHYCPKCRKRFHWSKVKEATCPQCGYDLSNWSLPTARGSRRGIKSPAAPRPVSAPPNAVGLAHGIGLGSACTIHVLQR